MRTKRLTILKRGKRTLLNMFYAAYEYQLDEYEKQYQKHLSEFELWSMSNVYNNELSLFDAIKTYINHHTNHMISDILKKAVHFREILVKRYQHSSLSKKMIGVSPEVTIDVLHCPYKAQELSCLSLD